MVRALVVWRYRGVPDNPRGWLYRVAVNRARDLVRRDAVLSGKLALLAPIDSAHAPDLDPFADHELSLIFLCCHPVLAPGARVALTLKVAGGFSVDEIAAALLASPATIAQRIVRAKRALRDGDVDLTLPDAASAMDRLDSVLLCLYLIFTEGYSAHGGDEAVRADLCFEAIRLGELLTGHPPADTPTLHALLALMYLQASRLDARCHDGDLVLLEHQDRSRWDPRLAAAGMRHLDLSARGETLTPWHVEAVIAAEFLTVDLDWQRILAFYDQLHRLAPSPVVRMNRAVAVGKVHGPRAALDELLPLASAELAGSHLVHALAGAFHADIGETVLAREAYAAALSRPCNAAERRFIEAELRRLGSPADDRSIMDEGPMPSSTNAGAER
jgi:RNA polymerase sigma-70 factor (ECF subfamily)